MSEWVIVKERLGRKERLQAGDLLWEDGEPIPVGAQLYTKDTQDNKV